MLKEYCHTAVSRFSNLRIAYGHFKTGRDDAEEYRSLEFGHYLLRALNPDYQDLPADDTMHTFARLKAVMGPQDLVEPEPE
jgi:hypothetical protein